MNFDKLLVRQDNNCLPLTSYFILLIKHRSHLLGPWVQWIPKSCSFPLLSRNWSTFAKKLSTTSSLGNSWSVLKCFPICMLIFHQTLLWWWLWWLWFAFAFMIWYDRLLLVDPFILYFMNCENICFVQLFCHKWDPCIIMTIIIYLASSRHSQLLMNNSTAL